MQIVQCSHVINLSYRAAGEDQTAPSETESENSNSQAFEMVEKDDVDAAELSENEMPEKGTGVEDLQEENSTDDTEVEKTTESQKYQLYLNL